MPESSVFSKVMMSLVRELAWSVVRPLIATVSAEMPSLVSSEMELSRSSLIWSLGLVVFLERRSESLVSFLTWSRMSLVSTKESPRILMELVVCLVCCSMLRRRVFLLMPAAVKK